MLEGDVRAEGLDGGPRTIEADMFPGQGRRRLARGSLQAFTPPTGWSRNFEAGRAAERMTPEVLAELQAFYDSDLGQRVAARVAARNPCFEPGSRCGPELAQTRAERERSAHRPLTEFIAAKTT